MKQNAPYIIKSISEYHAFHKLPKPTHPLVSVINFKDLGLRDGPLPNSISYNFFSINLKKDFDGKVKYGQQYYDFDDGVMSFYAPRQVITLEGNFTKIPKGYAWRALC